MVLYFAKRELGLLTCIISVFKIFNFRNLKNKIIMINNCSKHKAIKKSDIDIFSLEYINYK